MARDLRSRAKTLQAGGDVQGARAARDASLRHFEAGVGGVDFDRFLYPQSVLVDLGMMYYERKRFDDAATALGEATRAPPFHHRDQKKEGLAFEVLGLMKMQRRDPAGALGFFNNAITVAPGQTSVHVHRAKCLVMLQDALEKQGHLKVARQLHAEALKSLRSVTPDAPGYPEARRLLKIIKPPAESRP